jgi:hypothetical protein
MKYKYIEICCFYALSMYFYIIKMSTSVVPNSLLCTSNFHITKATAISYNIITMTASGGESAILIML